MKPTNMFKILTPLILGLFILSLFSGSVCALTPLEQYEKIKEQYQISNANAANNTSKELQMELKKKVILGAINFTQSHLQVLKIKVSIPVTKGIITSGNDSEAIKIIDTQLDQLEGMKVKVNQATNIQELRDVYNELKNIVVKINLETRYFMGIVLNNRIDNFIKKADNVSVKQDALIEEMKANGKDITKLVEYSDEFKKDLKEAKGIQAETLALFQTHSGFSADGVIDEKNAREFLRKANDLHRENILKLRETGREMNDFGKEFRKIFGKSEKGELEAIGENATMTATPAQTATPNQTAMNAQTAVTNQTAPHGE